MEQARRLNRIWMQQWMVDLLMALSARLENQALRAETDAALAASPFQPSGLARAERHLRDGHLAEALELITDVARDAEANGRRRERIVASEAELRALAELGRWAEVVWRADVALVEAEATGFRMMSWRILSHRARGRLEIGDHPDAARDAAAARQLLAAIAATVPDPELQAGFEAHFVAQSIPAL
jgi:hypothetical protein